MEKLTYNPEEGYVLEIPDSEDGNISVEKKSGMFDSISGIEVVGMPVGSIAVSMAMAALFTEVTNAVIVKTGVLADTQDKYIAAAVDVGAAVAIDRWAKDKLGADISNMTVALLTFDALRNVLPVDEWIRSILPWSQSVGFGARPRYRATPIQAFATQAAAKPGEFYDDLYGGRR